MKFYALLAFLIIGNFSFAQTVPQKIIAKIKPQYRNYFQQNLVTHPDLIPIFESQIVKTSQKWPNHSLPRNAEQGWVDLSLIFEFTTSSDKNTNKVLQQLQNSGLFEYVEPKFIAHTTATPNDPDIGLQPYLSQIEAQAAWDVWQGDPNTVVAIIDTGSDMDHPDLMDNMKTREEEPLDGLDNDGNGFIDDYTGWDFVDDDNFPDYGLSDHGVHVAGLSSASTNNETGVAGVSYNCPFITIRAGDGNSITHGYEGVVYAADVGADVINCSWGSTSYSNFANDIIRYATLNKDALVVAAAGNNNSDTPFYPAAYEYALAVGSVEGDDGRSTFSNYGYWLDICAPGGGLYNTIQNGEYGYKLGTSMASPVVAGAAALIRSKHPGFTALQTFEHIKTTADDISSAGWNPNTPNQIGAGRINLYQALTANLSNPAINAERILITDNDNEVFHVGDTLNISAFFNNYMAEAHNLVAEISIIEGQDALDIITPQFTIGSLSTYQYKTNRNSPFQVVIQPSALVNERVVIGISTFNNSYSTTDFIYFDVNVDYQNIKSQNLELTISSNSRFGYSKPSQKGGIGLRYKNGQSLLYEGGFMAGVFGLGEFRVADNIRNSPGGIDENFSQVLPLVEQPLMTNELERYNTAFTDTFSLVDRIGLMVTNNAYTVDLDGHENYIIMEYEVTNVSAGPRNQLVAGLFTDFDIAEYDKNRAITDYQRYMVITEYLGGNAPLAGVQLLSPNTFSSYCIDNNAGATNGVDLSDGFSSGEKYTTMSQWRAGAGFNFELGNDVITTCAADFGTLNAGDTAKFVFAIHAADNLQSLKASADSAYMRYNGGLPTSISNISEKPTEVKLFPNPTQERVTVQFSERIDQVEIYSIDGQLLSRRLSGSYREEIQLPEQSGVYIIKIYSENEIISKKVMKY